MNAVWCRRTDELVDGPNAPHITPKALDRWEQRLTDLFEGRPFDMYDAALSHSVSKYPVDIQVQQPLAMKKPWLIYLLAFSKIASFVTISESQNVLFIFFSATIWTAL